MTTDALPDPMGPESSPAVAASAGKGRTRALSAAHGDEIRLESVRCRAGQIRRQVTRAGQLTYYG